MRRGANATGKFGPFSGIETGSRPSCHHLNSSACDIYLSEEEETLRIWISFVAGDKASAVSITVKHTELTGSKSACGWGRGVLLELLLPSGLQHLNHVSRAPPPCISPQKVMDILSLAAWPLVILFHRPAPRCSRHNGRRSASSQLIFWQTWSSKLVSFGKGLTKALFNTLPESIKTSEQHVSFFFVLSFASWSLCVRLYPGFRLPCVFPPNCPYYWWRSKVNMTDGQYVIRISPYMMFNWGWPMVGIKEILKNKVTIFQMKLCSSLTYALYKQTKLMETKLMMHVSRIQQRKKLTKKKPLLDSVQKSGIMYETGYMWQSDVFLMLLWVYLEA